MKIDCNHHAASFCRENIGDEERYLVTDTPLGLEGEYTFVYTYPLSREARIAHCDMASASAIDILLAARKDYEHIYAAEENPGHIPGMLNRAISDGPYGIWGHDFSDLYFESIDIDTAKKVISFGMGS